MTKKRVRRVFDATFKIEAVAWGSARPGASLWARSPGIWGCPRIRSGAGRDTVELELAPSALRMAQETIRIAGVSPNSTGRRNSIGLMRL